MIVADTNLVAYLYLSTPHSQDAEAVLRLDSEWSAPLLWRSEFRNVLIGCIRRGQFKLDDAVIVMDLATELLHGREYAVASSEVLALAARSSCSAYDCEFVALALELGVPLVTADKRILAGFPETAVGPAEYSDR